MEHIAEAARETPVYGEFDVVVCGGGVAGAAAAICAARSGANVLLLERYGYLGGLATGGLVITVPPLDNGINVEIRRKLEDALTYRLCPNSGDDDPAVDGLIAVDPEVLKYEIVRLLQVAGVHLLLHSYVVQSLTEDGRITGVIVENKGGRAAILAKVVIDATGDGDAAASAGAVYEMEADPLPITLMSNLTGVDSARAIAQLGSWAQLRAVVEAARDRGDLAFDLEVRSRGYAPGVFAADLCYPGEVNLWSGSLFGVNALDPDQLTMAEIVTREHTVRLVDFLKRNVAGFEQVRIEYTASQIGVRETRRVVGGYTPTLHEVLKARFPDTVAKPYATREMRIPYRSLVPQGVDNLLIAGRCMSAEQQAMVQLRLIPVCVATGQAAGTAAALAVRENVTPRDLDVGMLQRHLEGQGVDLGLPSASSVSA
jgi:ribulose 1,5-bisphosphate synthetase/thiazole synthase